MSNLSTSYLGLPLRNPLVASPSPISKSLDGIRRLEDAGASAIVLHSLFEEQITMESHDLDHHLWQGSDTYAESLSYFPDLETYNLGPEGYLEHLRKAKAATSIPVLGSLNGISTGGWTKYAKYMEEAGADAIELNMYFVPSDPHLTGAAMESQYLELVRAVKAAVGIPVAVKISPFFSAMANMALRFEEAGADALVLFNRFYQPDLELETLEVVPNLHLSDSHELRQRLCWVGILHGKVNLDLAVTGGVHTAMDVLKCMMAGANIAMMTSALLKHGPGHISKVLDDIVDWMAEHDYVSIQQMQGSMSQKSIAEPMAYERANYIKVLSSYATKY
jgi:dihydroorotate dehydrogenase (fumarate)